MAPMKIMKAMKAIGQKAMKAMKAVKKTTKQKAMKAMKAMKKTKAMGPAELIFTVCSPCNTFIEQLQPVRSGFRVREYYCSNCGGPLEIQSAVY